MALDGEDRDSFATERRTFRVPVRTFRSIAQEVLVERARKELDTFVAVLDKLHNDKYFLVLGEDHEEGSQPDDVGISMEEVAERWLDKRFDGHNALGRDFCNIAWVSPVDSNMVEIVVDMIVL